MDIRKHVVALNEKRMRAAKALEQLVDDAHAAHPGEPFTAEERQEFDRINLDIDQLEDEVRRFVEREEREAEAAQLRETHAHVFGTERDLETRQRTDAAELRSWLRGEPIVGRDEDGNLSRRHFTIDLALAQREHEMLRQGASPEEVRALLWDTGSIASAVPTTLSRSLYASLRASIALVRMPTTKIVTTSGEPLQFPKVNAHSIATQVAAQGTALAGTDPTFLSMQLDSYKYGELLQISSETLQDEVVDIVGFVTSNVAEAVGRLFDTDLAVGSGSGAPNGVMTAITGSGTIATGGSLITPTYENLVDLVYSVNDSYRASGRACFLMRDATAGILRKLRSDAGGTTGPVLWEPSMTNGIQGGEPDRLLGYAVYTDPNIASCASNAKIMAFGDFGAYYVRMVNGFTFERSDDFAFSTDLVTFRGKMRGDGDVIDTTAINILKQSV